MDAHTHARTRVHVPATMAGATPLLPPPPPPPPPSPPPPPPPLPPTPCRPAALHGAQNPFACGGAQISGTVHSVTTTYIARARTCTSHPADVHAALAHRRVSCAQHRGAICTCAQRRRQQQQQQQQQQRAYGRSNFSTASHARVAVRAPPVRLHKNCGGFAARASTAAPHHRTSHLTRTRHTHTLPSAPHQARAAPPRVVLSRPAREGSLQTSGAMRAAAVTHGSLSLINTNVMLTHAECTVTHKHKHTHTDKQTRSSSGHAQRQLHARNTQSLSS
jgi:hypothetical protein